MPSDADNHSKNERNEPAGSAVAASGGAASEITAKPFARPTSESAPGVLGQSVPDRFAIRPKQTYASGEKVTFTYYVNSSGVNNGPIKEVGLLLGTKSGPCPFDKCLVQQRDVQPGSQQRTIETTVAAGTPAGRYEVLAALYPAPTGAVLSFELIVSQVPPLQTERQ